MRCSKQETSKKTFNLQPNCFCFLLQLISSSSALAEKQSSKKKRLEQNLGKVSRCFLKKSVPPTKSGGGEHIKTASREGTTTTISPSFLFIAALATGQGEESVLLVVVLAVVVGDHFSVSHVHIFGVWKGKNCIWKWAWKGKNCV